MQTEKKSPEAEGTIEMYEPRPVLPEPEPALNPLGFSCQEIALKIDWQERNALVFFVMTWPVRWHAEKQFSSPVEFYSIYDKK